MTTQQPDIIFIVLDTLRRDRLSAYGSPVDTSPHFDEFAAQSTLFERAVSPAQWTVPAHGSLFTGLYPGTHQLQQAAQRLPDAYPTLAGLLRAVSYHTVGFCNNPMVGILDNGLQRGFDAFYNYAGATPNRPHTGTSVGLLQWLMQRFRQFARYLSNRFAHNDLLFRLSLNPLIVPFWTQLVNYKGSTSRSIDDFIAYYDRYHQGGADRPLFAFLNLMGAHMPYHPPKNRLTHVAPHLVNDRHAYRFMRDHNADAAAWISPVEQPLADWQQDALTGFYDAEIAEQDYHLGRLLSHLRSRGKLDNTLVIITADHGDGHGDHDFIGHSFVVYQELVHVPLLMHYPDRFPAGKRVQTNISTRRIFHTALDFAGASVPIAEDNPNANVEGLSLVQATNGRPDTEGGIAFAEAFPPVNLLNVLERRQPDMIPRRRLTDIRRGVYDGDHKLAMVGSHVEGAYQLNTDPAEVNDVATHIPETVDLLRGRIDHFITDTEAQRATAAVQASITGDMVEQMRALGYME